jgi:thiamine-phosphate pyrophosphorylase
MTDKLARAKLARAAKQLSARGGLPALVLMTDDMRLADPVAATRALPRGSMVVLRTRQEEQRTKLAMELRVVTRARDIKLLIANDPELAGRIAADGLHLSQAHAHQAAHWRALHSSWIITVAAHSLRACHAPAADALFVAPVFVTASHPGAPVLGALRLRIVARQSLRPVYALGGVDAVTARQLEGAPLAGLAAIGALNVSSGSSG